MRRTNVHLSLAAVALRLVCRTVADKPELSIGLCVLVHAPTPGLPSKGPALLIDSRQFRMKLLSESFLPEQFWFDLREWIYEKQLPLVMTQRYVNRYGAKQVLLHDQQFCLNAYSTRDAEVEPGFGQSRLSISRVEPTCAAMAIRPPPATSAMSWSVSGSTTAR